MKRIKKAILAIVLSATLLLVTGLVILYFLKDSGTTLQDILFWVGGVPIALFSIGAFGDFFGKGNSSYQLSRSVSAQSANERSMQDESDKDTRTGFGLTWIGGGLVVWFISYFL